MQLAVTYSRFFFCLFYISIGAVNARPYDTVIDSGILRVFVYDRFPPFSFEQEGKMVGIDVDIGAEMANDLGVEVEYIVREADENVDDDLRVNVWKGPITGGDVADVMLHVPYHKELVIRNELVAFFGKYYRESISIAADESIAGTSGSLAPFIGKKIAVEVDTISDFFLSSAFQGRLRESAQRHRYFIDAVDAYNAGEADAIMAPTTQVEWAVAQGDRNPLIFEPKLMGMMQKNWDLGFAVRTDSRDLGYALEDTITKLISDGTMEAIFERYHTHYHPVIID